MQTRKYRVYIAANKYNQKDLYFKMSSTSTDGDHTIYYVITNEYYAGSVFEVPDDIETVAHGEVALGKEIFTKFTEKYGNYLFITLTCDSNNN